MVGRLQELEAFVDQRIGDEMEPRLYLVTYGKGHSGSGHYEQHEREVLAYTAEDAKTQVEIELQPDVDANAPYAYARVILVRPARPVTQTS